MTELDLQRPQFVPNESDVREVAKESSSFIPALKLIQTTSEENNLTVTDVDGAKITNSPGDFYHSGAKINFGKKIAILICPGWRPHALEMIAKQKKRESFNQDSPIYKAIISTREARDGKHVVSHGWEFLLYIPIKDLFASLFLGRPSNRKLPNEIFDYMREPNERENEAKKDLPHTNYFELFSQFESWGQNRFWVPHVAPRTLTQEFLPPKETLEQNYNIFMAAVLNEPKVTEKTDEVAM